MKFLENGYVQLEENEVPQLRNNRVGNSVKDVVEKQAAFITTKKQGQDAQQYVTKLNLVDPVNNIYEVVAADPLSSYALKSMAGTVQGAFDNRNANNRFAGATIQQILMEAQGKPVDTAAAARSYGRNSALGYETHHINEIDTQMQIIASLSPEGQEEYVKKLIDRGYRLSDDPRNQVPAFGSVENVPGYVGPNGEKMVPNQHPGFSVHKAIHDEIRELAQQKGLPDSRLSTGDNTIPSRMAGLPNEVQRVAMGMALTEVGRLAAMRKLAKPGSERFAQRHNAEAKQLQRVRNEVANMYAPGKPVIQSIGML